MPKDGYGEFVWPNGDKYKGEIRDGKKHGEGKFETIDGIIYAGYFKDDKLNGPVEIFYPNGDYFKGIWDVKIEGGLIYDGELQKRFEEDYGEKVVHSKGKFETKNYILKENGKMVIWMDMER